MQIILQTPDLKLHVHVPDILDKRRTFTHMWGPI